MEKINGERILSEPEQVLVGQHILDGDREVDSEAYKDQAKTRVEARGLVVRGENVQRGFAHHRGPGHPLCFILGVGGEEEADQNENRGEDTSWPFASRAPGLVRRVLRKVGKEYTEKELHSKSSWISLVLQN